MKILILGGTRYFGQHLMKTLLDDAHEVTVASRGNQDFPFKDQVKFIKADRNNLEDLKRLAALGPFDIIYDQICMSGAAADKAVNAFKESCKKYVFTSTGSVYDAKIGTLLNEEKFDYKSKQINLKETEPYDYQEAKRQAEAVFGQQSFFKVAMVRFPIVLGLDDYTKRLKFHVEKVKKEEEIFFPNLEMKMTFVESNEAGRFLKFIGQSDFTGAINCASDGSITMIESMKEIEMVTGKKAILAKIESKTNHSPFGFVEDFVLPNGKAKSLGFSFLKLNQYLPKLIKGYL